MLDRVTPSQVLCQAVIYAIKVPCGSDFLGAQIDEFYHYKEEE